MVEMIITYTMLVKEGACPKGLRLFEIMYPNGFEVTRENIESAYKSQLAVNMFFLANFLPRRALTHWHTIDTTFPGTTEEMKNLISACKVAGWIK